MKIGYARVSTTDQNPALQVNALEEAGCDEIVEERASGRSRKRPELQNVLDRLGEGDELIVWKIDRLGRSVLDLETIIKELVERRATFRSITEPQMNTSGPAGDLVRTILSAVAQYERALIAERVANGFADVRKNGPRPGKQAPGRPRRLSVQDEDDVLAEWETTSVASLARRYKVNDATIYRARQRALARREGSGGTA